MFEEEAEEYKDNTRIKDKNTYIGFPDERISEVQDYEGNYIDISERIIKTFKDGANIGYNKGYNKAKEEMQEQGLALQSDMDKTIEQNIALKKELNEANEWHYVKDGDLPKINDAVLIYWKFGDKKCTSVVEPYKVAGDKYIIAWKEIVLPEEE